MARVSLGDTVEGFRVSMVEVALGGKDLATVAAKEITVCGEVGVLVLKVVSSGASKKGLKCCI